MHTATTSYAPRALAGLVLLSVASALAACGEDASAPPTPEAPAAASVALDPESMRGVDVDLGDLSDAERRVLLRAKGRRWTAVSAADLSDYLAGEADRTTWLYVWDPDAGVAALREFQRAAERRGEAGARLAVGVVSAADSDDLLVALRASQVPYPAFRIGPRVAAAASPTALSPGSVHVTTGGLDHVSYANVDDAFGQ